MPRMTEETLTEFLAEPHVGVIATIRRDGLPYTVPVWWLHDEGAFWLTGTVNRVWCRHLAERPQCSLCIEALAPVAGHVGVDGTAERFESPGFDIWPLSRRLAEKYVATHEPAGSKERTDAVDRFFHNMRTEPRILYRLTPATWRAIDMRVYRGKRADREFQERQR